MIRTSWNQDGLLQIEVSAEIAQELVTTIDWGPATPDVAMLLEMIRDRLDKPQRRRGDAQTKA